MSGGWLPAVQGGLLGGSAAWSLASHLWILGAVLLLAWVLNLRLTFRLGYAEASS